MTRRSKISGAAITPSGKKVGKLGLNRFGSRFEKQLLKKLFHGLPFTRLSWDKCFMLIHSVFFWLKPDINDVQRAAFLAGLESLRAVESVHALYVGAPAPIPPRPVVDASYSYALTVLFKDVAAHNAYQVDPLHRAFVENLKSAWTRVQIYDAN